MPIQRVISSGKRPVKIWTRDIDENAEKQLAEMSTLPFVHHHIAVMPDVHWGMGATIGSVIPTKGAIVPAAVGVDLGCGMSALQTSLKASDLPDNLGHLRATIEATVPHGRTDNGGKNDVGSWKRQRLETDKAHNLYNRYQIICGKHPKARGYNSFNHLGTLGTGNHFIEICLDLDDNVWIVLHSGSRGPGNKIGSYFIEMAKEEMERYHITDYLANKDLSYLVENTEMFDDYVEAVEWAQDFAALNREHMMQATCIATANAVKRFDMVGNVTSCHHNYIARENHFGANVIVTRKGAIRAREGDMGIIPGSMGDRSYIVRGKGNKESMCSCSHGAGRTMGRKEAQRKFTAADLAAQTEGIECPKGAEHVDEIPAAYKRIEDVMANQSDLVEVVTELRQVVNVKG